MNPRFAFATAVFAAGLTASAVTAAAEPPAQPEPSTHAAAADNSVGFLGISVAESPAPPNAGADVPPTVLLVGQVMPDSPADAAGLRSGDILLKVDGQHLLHPVQFQRLIAFYSAGQKIELLVIRNGQPQTLAATLGERPAELAPIEPIAPANPGAARLRLLEDPNGLEQPWRLAQPLELEQMRQRMNEQLEQMFPDGVDQVWPDGNIWKFDGPIQFDFDNQQLDRQVTIIQDNQHRLTVTGTAEGRHLSATDREGNVLFEGPIDTPEQLDAVPDEIQTKIPKPGAGRLKLRLQRDLDLDNLFERLQPPAEGGGADEKQPQRRGRAV